jgi:hypothetical protein
MNKAFYHLTLPLIILILHSTGIVASSIHYRAHSVGDSDTIAKLIHPEVKRIFYDFPLEKSSDELREFISNDIRFEIRDTVHNNQKTASLFLATAAVKGLIDSTPDSMQVQFALGNTLLAIEKGSEADFRNIMLIIFKYYFSNEQLVEKEYEKMLDRLCPILKDSTSEKSVSPYKIGLETGQMIMNGKLFEHFKPYYRIGVSVICMLPTSQSKPVYILEIVFGKEDK